MAKRIEAKNYEEAWAIANEIFPTDYVEDEEASQRAGYPTYRSTVEYYDYIDDLNDRLEINLKGGRTINVWITGEDKDAEIEDLKAKNKNLQDELDKELEWKDCENAGTNMSQEKYLELVKYGVTLTDDDAKDLIHKYFGFDPEKVELIHKANTYEVNRHHLMRVKQSYSRQPLYDATDWNYIRFDCAGWSYEMINGELRQYES